MGLYGVIWGYIGGILGLQWDDGKENGNYSSILSRNPVFAEGICLKQCILVRRIHIWFCRSFHNLLNLL